MVKSGFDEVDKRFDGVDKRFNGIDKRLENLEQGQEEIKMKLDNVVYRFEYDELRRDHALLLNRIVALEKKVLKRK